MSIRVLQPEGWPRPRGYANGVSATGRMIFVAGQIGWNAKGRLAKGGIVPQSRKALENILTILALNNTRTKHIMHLT